MASPENVDRVTNPNCEICGKPATSWILRDPFGKSDATRPACADHAPQFHNPADVIEITQLRGNLSLAEEGLASYALEVDGLQKQIEILQRANRFLSEQIPSAHEPEKAS